MNTSMIIMFCDYESAVLKTNRFGKGRRGGVPGCTSNSWICRRSDQSSKYESTTTIVFALAAVCLRLWIAYAVISVAGGWCAWGGRAGKDGVGGRGDGVTDLLCPVTL